jgi:DNA-binding response OmpR family regulator
MSGSWWNLRDRDSLVDDPEQGPPPGLLVVSAEADSAVLRELAAPQLTTIAASGCREARVLFRTHRPALVLADERLPEGCGLDLLRELKAEAPATVCVLLTSSCCEASLLVRALNEPGLLFRCVPRPFDPAALRLDLLRGLAQARASQGFRAGFLGC